MESLGICHMFGSSFRNSASSGHVSTELHLSTELGTKKLLFTQLSQQCWNHWAFSTCWKVVFIIPHHLSIELNHLWTELDTSTFTCSQFFKLCVFFFVERFLKAIPWFSTNVHPATQAGLSFVLNTNMVENQAYAHFFSKIEIFVFC